MLASGFDGSDRGRMGRLEEDRGINRMPATSLISPQSSANNLPGLTGGERGHSGTQGHFFFPHTHTHTHTHTLKSKTYSLKELNKHGYSDFDSLFKVASQDCQSPHKQTHSQGSTQLKQYLYCLM